MASNSEEPNQPNNPSGENQNAPIETLVNEDAQHNFNNQLQQPNMSMPMSADDSGFASPIDVTDNSIIPTSAIQQHELLNNLSQDNGQYSAAAKQESEANNQLDGVSILSQLNNDTAPIQTSHTTVTQPIVEVKTVERPLNFSATVEADHQLEKQALGDSEAAQITESLKHQQVVNPLPISSSPIRDLKRAQLAGSSYQDQEPIRLIVSTTRSPRVFPILSQVSTFDQVIAKKLPTLRERIKPEEHADLYYMVSALESKRKIFEQAFITVKQVAEQQDQENAAEGATVDDEDRSMMLRNERLDMIPVRDTDKVVEDLTKNLPMDLEEFFQFFQSNYSIEKTSFTITLAQFIQIYIVYIEQTFKKRKDGVSFLKQPFHRASESMTEETLKRYLFGENFMERQDLISEKLQKHGQQIRKLFEQINPEDPKVLPMGRLKEFWLQASMVMKCIMVKAGTEYKQGQTLTEDPFCREQLHEHMVLAHYMANRTLPESTEKAILRAEGSEWPREFIKRSIESRDPEAIIRPKILKFADEHCLKDDPLAYDEYKVEQDFIMKEIEEFFQTRRSVVLVDLDALKNQGGKEEAKEVTLEVEQEPTKEPPLQRKVTKKEQKKTYVELDPNYVPPPSQVSPEAQKTIDKNVFEVFNFYCRKFAAVKGDFQQKNQQLIVLGLQGYTRFVKDFKVPLSSSEITTVWKKSSNNHQPHELEQFTKSLTLLGVTLNQSQVQKFNNRQKLLKQELKRREKQVQAQSNNEPRKPTAPNSTKTTLEKMSKDEIQGELSMLDSQIGRTSILTENQSTVQIYSLLEIQYPDKYRQKLPVSGQNELRNNIMMTKKLGSNPDGSSQVGASSRYSGAQSVVARLTSNPPPIIRHAKPVAFVQKVKAPAPPRNKTQTRPTSLLSQSPNTKSMKALESFKKPLDPVNNALAEIKQGQQKSGAFQRKQTERSVKSPPLRAPSAKVKQPKVIMREEPIIKPNVQVVKVDDQVEQKERQNLAEIHKRIRLEKQQTGRIITVPEARKLIEQVPQKPPMTKRQQTLERNQSKDNMTPSKLIPLSQINKSKRQPPIPNKTPSVIDLVPEQSKSPTQAKGPTIPVSLTFEDIQKMHYTNFAKGGKTGDEFKPEDFLDLDSGDSDNEVLQQFKPEQDQKMIGLLQPQSPIKKFVPDYLAAANNNIDEQTGYSNSPKFSIYRLNNQSHMKDGANGDFEEQVANLDSQHRVGINDQSQLFEEQNQYFEQPQTQPDAISGNYNVKTQKSKVQVQSRKSGMRNPHLVPIATPQSQKTKGSIKNQSKKTTQPLGQNSRPELLAQRNRNDIFSSHGQIPTDTPNLNHSGEVLSRAPQLNINENISEINNVSNKNGTLHMNDERTTTMGVLSIFNEKQTTNLDESPTRLPARKILEVENGLDIKRNSGIGEGLTNNNPLKASSGRHMLQVGSARVGGSSIEASSKKALSSQKRIGQLNQNKRQSKNTQSNKQSSSLLQQRQLRPQNNFTEQHMMETNSKIPDPIMTPSENGQISGIRQSQQLFRPQIVDGQTAHQLQSMLPATLSRDAMVALETETSSKVGKTNSAVSNSNQRALMRAQEQHKLESQNKQRRMDGLMNLHEKNLKKGLNTANRR